MKILIGVVACLLAGLASAQSYRVEPGYKDFVPPIYTEVTVRVIWAQDRVELANRCGRPVNGCFDLNTNTIITLQPVNFNDVARMYTLGHEFLHALGAMHERID